MKRLRHLENGKWKWSAGFRDMKMYTEFGKFLWKVDGLNPEDVEVMEYRHSELSEIIKPVIRDFYGSPAIKPKFTYADTICDLWSAIFDHDVKVEPTNEFYYSLFPNLFIEWLTTEYYNILEGWYADEVWRLQTESEDKLKVIHEERLQARKRRRSIIPDDELF